DLCHGLPRLFKPGRTLLSSQRSEIGWGLRTSTRELAPSPGSINAPTHGPTADIGFGGSAGTGSCRRQLLSDASAARRLSHAPIGRVTPRHLRRERILSGPTKLTVRRGRPPPRGGSQHRGRPPDRPTPGTRRGRRPGPPRTPPRRRLRL